MSDTTERAEALRQRVREFMQTRVPAEYIERTRSGLGLNKQEQEHWHSLLDSEGWLVNHGRQSGAAPVGLRWSAMSSTTKRPWAMPPASCRLV